MTERTALEIFFSDNDQTYTLDKDLVIWAYTKLINFGMENSSMESALMMDRLKLVLSEG